MFTISKHGELIYNAEVLDVDMKSLSTYDGNVICYYSNDKNCLDLLYLKYYFPVYEIILMDCIWY